MKGNNELRLNTATMIEAVQQWINGQMAANAPTVTSVKPGSDPNGVFIVSLSGDAANPMVK